VCTRLSASALRVLLPDGDDFVGVRRRRITAHDARRDERSAFVALGVILQPNVYPADFRDVAASSTIGIAWRWAVTPAFRFVLDEDFVRRVSAGSKPSAARSQHTVVPCRHAHAHALAQAHAREAGATAQRTWFRTASDWHVPCMLCARSLWCLVQTAWKSVTSRRRATVRRRGGFGEPSRSSLLQLSWAS